MPTYDYRCKKCGHQFEAFHPMNDSVTECPVCEGNVEKMMSAGSGLIFKGSGFYITDYKNAKKTEKVKEEPAKKEKSDKKTQS